MGIIITLAICFVLVTALVENHQGTIAFLALVGTGLLVHFVITPFVGEVLSWIQGNVLTLILLVLGYCIIGCLWSFYKWGEYLGKKYTEYDSYRTPGSGSVVLSENKDKIALWIGYWPTSLFWFCLRNPFTWIGRTLTEKLQHVYINIATRQLNKIRPKGSNQA